MGIMKATEESLVRAEIVAGRSQITDPYALLKELTRGRRVGGPELAAFCEPRLPHFAVPRYVELMSELPRTENGKVQKYKLRERGVGPATWDRGPTRPRNVNPSNL